MDPTHMPEEVAALIFASLSVGDLLSCSLVNSRWRIAVNKDTTWKRHCSSEICLENVESVVEPVFELPQSVCENLTPVCKYRQNYMREIHLKNNYRHNRYVVKRKQINTEGFHKLCILQGYFVGWHILHKELCVWSIEDDNPDKMQSVPPAINCDGRRHFKFTEKCFIVVLETLLQMYVVKDGKLTLVLSRLFDKEENFSDNIPTIDSSIDYSMFRSLLASWYQHSRFRNGRAYVDAVGNYFVGAVNDPSQINQSMHIWNLESGKKLKEEAFPGYGGIDMLRCNMNSENLYIFIDLYYEQHDYVGEKLKIFCYSLKSMDQMKFCVELDHSFTPYVNEQVIVLVGDESPDPRILLILDASTGCKIYEKIDFQCVYPNFGVIHNSVFVYPIEGKIIGMDLNTKENSFVLSTDIEISELHFLYDNLLIMIGSHLLANVFQIWDIRTMRQLYDQNNHDLGSLTMFKQNIHKLNLVFSQDDCYIIHNRNYW